MDVYELQHHDLLDSSSKHQLHPSIEEYCKGFRFCFSGLVLNLLYLLGLELSDQPQSNVWYGLRFRFYQLLLQYQSNTILAVSWAHPLLLTILYKISKFLVQILEKHLGQFKWNFFLRVFIQYYLELLSASFLALRVVTYN